MTARFVILHHRLPDGEHWDLMLETDGKLATWQLPRLLTCSGDLPIPARRIGDHRLAYLSYEGPVSGNRGKVQRVASGLYELLTQTDRAWTLNLGLGHPLPIRLSHRTGDQWEVTSVD